MSKESDEYKQKRIDEEPEIIAIIEQNQKEYKEKIFDKLESTEVDAILINIAQLFNTYIVAHEKVKIFSYTDKKLYRDFSRFINAVRLGIEIFEYEMSYKPIQAADEKRFLKGEQKRLLYRFKDKISYNYYTSIGNDVCRIFLEQLLTPDFHNYKQTIEKLVQSIYIEKSFKECMEADIFLATRVHLLVDVYSYFIVAGLLENKPTITITPNEVKITPNTLYAYLLFYQFGSNIERIRDKIKEFYPDKEDNDQNAIKSAYYNNAILENNRKSKNGKKYVVYIATDKGIIEKYPEASKKAKAEFKKFYPNEDIDNQ
jgi:hypothetical protein